MLYWFLQEPRTYMQLRHVSHSNGTTLRDTTNTSLRELKADPAANVSVGSSRDFSRRFPVQVQENFPDCGGVFGDQIARVQPPNNVLTSSTVDDVSSLKGSQAEVIQFL